MVKIFYSGPVMVAISFLIMLCFLTYLGRLVRTKSGNLAIYDNDNDDDYY